MLHSPRTDSSIDIVTMSSNFRVLIVGGAFGGLTLAMALEHAGIDYLLLESKSTFTPPTGATVGLQPNGGRIADQLGLYDKMLATKATILEVSWINSVDEILPSCVIRLVFDHIDGVATSPNTRRWIFWNRTRDIFSCIFQRLNCEGIKSRQYSWFLEFVYV